MTVVVAVDFGASSIRVCRVDLDRRPPAIEVVHRVEHGPVRGSGGRLRWDWDRLVTEMHRGLERATATSPVASIGVDTWGVDYGLLDRHGDLVAPPHSYRDDRTADHREVVERVGERRLYEIAGLQLLPFNTIFQLAAHAPDELAKAQHVVMLPELLVHELTGTITAERTSAGTTGLLDVATERWSDELCAAIELDPAMLGDVRPAGTCAGTWRGIPVHLVGGHDTASAVVAMGADPSPGSAFVSTGTWLLVGREQAAPDRSEVARAANFTNELGAHGGIRFLTNVAGFWLLDQCRVAWGDPDPDHLLAEAAAITTPVPTFDACDDRFLAPPEMEAEIVAAAGLGAGAPPALVTRCIIESMAQTTATVLDRLGGVTEVSLFGGGSRSSLLRDRLADLSGVPVRIGPVEATALGNALSQGIAIGCYRDLADARHHLVEVEP